MGTLDEKTLKLTGKMKNVSIAGESFRNSIAAKPGEKSWLTSEVLTATLGQFTSDLTAAELKAQGFNDAQIKAIQQTATTAMKAATQVKTLQGVLDTARETAGSGWAQTWQIIFGDFGEAKTLFTAVSNSINGFIKDNADARNKVLADWKALGGRTVLINSIRLAFHNLGMVIQPIKDAFRDIFPATTGRDLYNLTLRFAEFTKTLRPGPETIENLRRTFRGLFALLDIGKQIIGGIFTVFGQLFGAVHSGSGGFLEFTGSIGDFLVSVDEALKKGNRLHNFFVALGTALGAPLRILSKVAGAIAELFSGFSAGGFSDQVGTATRVLTPFQRILLAVSEAWDHLIDSFSNTGVMRPALEAIISLVEGLGTAIGQAASNMNFDAILQVIRTGLFGGIFLLFKNFLGKGTLADQLGGLGGGIIQNIAGSFKALQGSMVAMQNNIKAKTLKEIAIAIGILSVSILALSFVDPDKLKSSLTAITVGLGQLVGAMAILDKISKGAGFLKLPVIAGGMILLAGAIDVLAIAVIALSRLSWQELARGLGAVAFLLGAIALAVIPLSANSAGMVRAGIGITAIAIAMKILASAVKDFGTMNWTEIAKGLTGVGVGLGVLVGVARVMPKNMAITGAGLILLASGLKILASAVGDFGAMDWRTIAKGLAAVAGSLVAIALAMKIMPQGMLLQAAALVAVSFALGKIADAVVKMGGMSISQIAKGLITLGGALVILAGALYLMSGTLAGAAALTVAAAGIAIFAPALEKLGKLSWGTIIKGLIALALAFTVIGVAGAAITAAVPGLLGFGAAMVLVGAGLALAGAGIFLISAGFSALVVAAPTGVGVIVAAFISLQKGIIENVKLLILGLLEIVKALAATAPQFVTALVKILNSLLDVVIQSTPKIVEAFNALIRAALQVLHDNQTQIIQAGFDLLVALLQGIKKNIPQLVTLVVDIVVRFIQTLSANMNRIVAAGTNLLISFVKGIASNIGRVATAAVDIVVRFLGTIATNLFKFITAGAQIIVKLIQGITSGYGDIIRAGADAIIKLVKGLGSKGTEIVAAAADAMGKFITQMAKSAAKLANTGAEAIVIFMNGIAAAIENNSGAMRAAGGRIAFAIVDGLTFGLAGKARDVAAQAANLGHSAIGALKGAVGMKSPSKEANLIGEAIAEGLGLGMEDTRAAMQSAEYLGNSVIGAFNDVFQTASPSKVMMEIGQYVGQGFAQGLRGSSDDIRSAFTDLNNKLTEAMTTARETIASENEKLEKLRASKKPDAEAIKKVQAVIAENEALLARSTAGHIALTKTLKDEKATLVGLAGDYEKIGEKLKNAKDVLADATRTRDEAIKGFADQYATLPDIVTEDAEGNSIDQLAVYMEALNNQAKAVSAYQSTLDQLRKLGLDDATYQKLLREGPADQQFATQLLSGGKTAVASLNTLDRNLMKVSQTLATNAGKNLYQAGVDAAQGLVNGLKAKQSAIRRTMEDIAHEMLDALRRELKIKSPSEAFAEIGALSMEGMAKGFADSTHIVADAMDQAAKDALSSMRESMRNISDAVSEELDPSPVITPILDLTLIRGQARELSMLTTPVPITATASFGQASIIASQQRAAQTEPPEVAVGGTHVKFEQNNYSPEALTEIEIYRQTKNQLSQLKSALAIT